MLPKPLSCRGCVGYGDGLGFVPDLHQFAQVTVAAQNPGAYEERGERCLQYVKRGIWETELGQPEPLIGPTGHALTHTWLPLAGLSRDQVNLVNMIHCRWVEGGRKVDTLPTGQVYREMVEHCTTQHLQIPPETTLIIAMGAHAFRYFGGDQLKKWSYAKQSFVPATITDWRGFLLPEPWHGIPVYCVLHPADLFRDRSMLLPTRRDWTKVKRILAGDWPKPVPDRVIVDRLLHEHTLHALFDEAEQAPRVYCDTEFVPGMLTLIGLGWEKDGELRGMQLEWLTRDVPSQLKAIFVQRFKQLISTTVFVAYNAKADLGILKDTWGVEYSDYGSLADPMQAHAVLWSEMDHDFEFVASLYGEYPKLKHLKGVDELLYNWGDVIDLHSIERALDHELREDPQSDRVYRGQNLKLIPITLEREKLGLRVDQARVDTLIHTYTTKLTEADQMVQVYAGYPINLMSTGVTGQVAHYLTVYEKVKLQSINKESVATAREKFAPFDQDYEDKQGWTVAYLLERIDQGAHPLLEIRAMKAHDQYILDQELLPLQGKQRVYPEIAIHAQESGRWSWKHPAIGKVPPELLDIYIPDEGYVLFGGDWDAQEPRIFMATTGSTYLQKALLEGQDIHTELAKDLFGWTDLPHGWSKDDKRRVACKNIRYMTYYDPFERGHAAQKYAVKLGLTKADVERAITIILTKDPAVAAFHRKLREIGQSKTRTTRTWGGRLRTHFSEGDKVVREMCNQYMQGGGADLLNLTLVEILQTYPFVRLFYTRHDSFKLEIPKERDTPHLRECIKLITEQARTINGMDVTFPMTWST